MNHQHTLTLMRHAKSSWKTQNQSDHDRPLNARGHRDAPEMARRLVDRRRLPDLVFSSSATRAVMTAEHMMEIFKTGATTLTTLQVEPKLYLASPTTILKLLNAMDPNIRHILVVAHNPGLEDLSAQLLGEAPSHLPTAAIRQFSCPTWADVRIDRPSSEQPTINLIDSDFPKNTPI